MKTHALVVSNPGDPFTYRSIEVNDTLLPTEVLVEIKATGVCHTDINFAAHSIPGLFPAVLGHEGAGIISRVGTAVQSVKAGDQVLLSYTSCGSCKYCERKETSFCDDWERDNFGVGRADGSKAYGFVAGEGEEKGEITSHFFGQSCFSKYAVVDSRCCVKVGEAGDKTIDLEMLAPLGCGIMTGAGAMLHVLTPSLHDTICIVGAGAVGLAALMSLNFQERKPKQIIVVDVVDERLKMAVKYGATHTVNSRNEKDLKAALKELTKEKGIDRAIDTTGRPDIVGDLLESAAQRGLVCSVGVGAMVKRLMMMKLDEEVKTNIFNTVNSGRVYTGCCMGNCYPPEFLPKLIQGWKDGKFPFTDLMRKYDAKEAEMAKKDVLSGKVVKAVLVWE
ncbi:alcohol dehydrogenase protein [Rutstroemia sp. NJR-2017a BBW]|nr:alcohol dehydrogenase protein [Rutstroemia sp. NJR-2017a BBW]